MSKKAIDTTVFIEAYEMETSLWIVYSLYYKNWVAKANAKKKLTEEFKVKSSIVTICLVIYCAMFLVYFMLMQ